jgi:hypothetical protein
MDQGIVYNQNLIYNYYYSVTAIFAVKSEVITGCKFGLDNNNNNKKITGFVEKHVEKQALTI